MIRHRLRGDAGQAFPIYITVVAGLLFLAFAYFAVGQAAALRNGAQTAADAAALAAAQDVRDQMYDGFLDAVEEEDAWEDWLGGGGLTGVDEGAACAQAADFAARNSSSVNPCQCSEEECTVAVHTDSSIGKTIVPGTEGTRGEADATAVVEPRCRVETGDTDSIEFSCDGEDWIIDPDDLDDSDVLPEAADLFSVYLTE
ncbi:pilus assembly protein TadG-related protein [Streptomyces sp. S07_1.15]|uniref:pilus assembly protein TadG-related protein n=1 Tax=Streptomyces sp. S07_1.15 TaxID=2873925 RepID=UPI00223EC1A8|nr:pilus assembly protein TadG-related protein [Streptomyces sp. S07_1.15]